MNFSLNRIFSLGRSINFSLLTFVCLIQFSLWNSVSRAEDGYAILPDQLILNGTEARQKLIIQKTSDNVFKSQVPVSDTVQFVSEDPGIVKIENEIAIPVSDGTTTISVTIDGKKYSQPITVQGTNRTAEWSFRNHIEPILTKATCNSGACHGALAGKGGFKLSLHGYDPDSDYFNITRQSQGRRIELADPGNSLLLTKPSGTIAHKGGVKLDVNSNDYRIVAEWISQGIAPPKESDRKVERLEIYPSSVLMNKGEKQQILVTAIYSDGHREDVTNWSKYTSVDESIASVDKTGMTEVIGYGEGAITVWFSSKIAFVRVRSSYENEISEEQFAKFQPKNFIDDLVLKKLKQLNIAPSGEVKDEQFIRRVYIDTTGTLPKPEKVEAYLQDTSPDKRDKLIDKLLASEEFVDYWTYKWSDVLLLNSQNLRPKALTAYYNWIHDNVKQNVPWDQFVRNIITAQGSSFENGATNFYALHQSPETLTENICKSFMGLTLDCAKCHNHPLEKWTNDQYYAMANMVSRVRAKGWGGDSRNGDGLRTLYVVSSGELIQPKTGKPQPPTPLDGTPLSMDSTEDRRIELANWLTAPENPYFSKAITNRIWGNYFHTGLVEPIDDLRVSNPPSNEELLQAAADYLVSQNYDLKSLMKVILQSATYQRSSEPLPENQDEKRFYSRYYPRRMMAEVLLDGISQITGVPTDFKEIEFNGADVEKTDLYPKGTRAIELQDSAVRSYFLNAFGRNERMITCECERSNEPSLIQVLHISNGDTINQKLRNEEGNLVKCIKEEKAHENIIRDLYLSSLSRYPTDREQEAFMNMIAEAKTPEEKKIVLEDLYWAILSSKEFLFNH